MKIGGGRRWPVGVVGKTCTRRVRLAYLMDESSVISVKNISMKVPTSYFQPNMLNKKTYTEL